MLISADHYRRQYPPSFCVACGSRGAEGAAPPSPTMASVLSSFFARDPKAQFGWDIPASPTATIDGVHCGDTFKKSDPSEKGTMFWCSGDVSSLRKQAQKLRTMRHPGVLTYVDSVEVDSSLYLVTEPCVPLSTYIQTAQATPQQREALVAWGVYHVMSTLKFLHEASLSHESIRRSVFVTPAGDWKIAKLEDTAAFSSPRTDLNQLGIVMWEVFNGFDSSVDRPQPPGKIPHRMHDLYKKIASPAAARLTVADIIRDNRSTGGLFKNKFVDMLLFLEEFQLKEPSEKQSFFVSLRECLDLFPADVAKYKLLPKLIMAYEYGDAGPNILVPMFKLGKLLDEDEYQRRIVPCLVKLFSSPDRTTRVKLLEKIDEFAPHLTTQVVNEKIYGNLATGFLDSSPAVRESTVKAMVSLAEKLNTHNLNQDLMKYLAKLQGTDEHGGIRTNTTICLGKIGCWLEPGGRQRILLGAFTRGVKDPFPPARLSAVLALSATQQFYSLVEVANRVLPALSPLTCDPEKQVRDQAFKALRGFLDKLEKASENPECIPELEAQVKAGGRGLLSGDKVPQWASWALKSLSGKFYKGPSPVEGAGGAGGGEGAGGAQSPRAGSQPPTGAASANAAAVSAAPKKAPANDGWGELEEGGEEDEWADAETGTGGGGGGGGWDDAGGDEDDWGTGWESSPAAAPVKTVEKPKPAVGAPKLKAPSRGAGGGGLKLGGGAAKAKPVKVAEEEDLDYLLGATNQPKKKTSTTGLSFGVAESGSVGGGGGWDDFGGDEEKSSGGGGGWGEWDEPADEKRGWISGTWSDGQRDRERARRMGELFGRGGGPAVVPVVKPVSKPLSAASSTSSLATKDKDARRAELAARNEQRKAELAARRAARGAMKLGGAKDKEKAADEFTADW